MSVSINENGSTLCPDAPVFVAGHRGLAGSAIYRALLSAGCLDILTRTSDELDLRERGAVFDFFADSRPRTVVLAAAKVGGIVANDTYPSDFLSDNLRIQVNVLDAAAEFGVPRLIFLGSSCIYPKFARQPIREQDLLTGVLEPTNEAYAIAKIAGIQQVKAVRKQYGLRWISAMPTNLYGPGDNFSPELSHVIPGMIRRFEDARLAGAASVTNWGSGAPRREFLHSDDLATAVLHLLAHYDDSAHVNVGTGRDTSIKKLAEIVASAVGFDGEIFWDRSKPDGTPRKVLDVTTIAALGWEPEVSLRDGVASTVRWYRDNEELRRS